MFRNFIFCICVLILYGTTSIAHAAPTTKETGTVRLVAGTSLIEDIVRDLMGDQCQILTLSQGSSCPGHDNARTQDFIFVAKADLILVHGFQQDLPLLSTMLEAMDKVRVRPRVVDVTGSWLIPENQKKAILSIAAILKTALPAQANHIDARSRARLERVDQAARDCAQLLAPIRGKGVVAARMQAEFVTWAGLKVLHSYGRAEDLSAKELTMLVQNVRHKGVRAIIDNYQSGPEAGLPLALELKVPHRTLSNFPGSDPSVPDYFSLLFANVALLSTL